MNSGESGDLSKARTTTDGMFLAATRAITDESQDEKGDSTTGVLPPLGHAKTVSRRIARAVAAAAAAEGVRDPIDSTEIDRRLDETWWDPEYSSAPFNPAGGSR